LHSGEEGGGGGARGDGEGGGAALKPALGDGGGGDGGGCEGGGGDGGGGWPLHGIAMINIVWRMANTRGVGGESYIAQSSCSSSAMVWAMRAEGGITRYLIRACRPQSKTVFCKRQGGGEGDGGGGRVFNSKSSH